MKRVPAVRVVSAVVAVLGLVGLIAVWPADPARADTATDQITGNGTTNSQVVVNWAQGLVGADNRTVVAARDPNSPYAFMYPDFRNLSVTVSQTENLVHQAIKVTWTGGKETKQPFRANFLQMMQCYGDAVTGPTPEQCEYGSFGLLPAGATNARIGSRGGTVCSSRSPSPTTPPGGVGGTGPGVGCDPTEPSDLSHLDPQADNQDSYSVPFNPVGLPEKVYGQSTEFYDQFNTNEQQQVPTRPDGTGQQFFQTLTATQAPGLGCGLRQADGKTRGCWLVIVPRGEYEPNGWKINEILGPTGYINESPLGGATWAQRIQIHLDFDPLQPPCVIGSAKERATIGTELVAHAIFSWQLALNNAGNCKTIFGYATTPEATDTTQLADPTGTGLAFTTVPIGDEATRNGTPVPTLPSLVYAPMTVSALSFGFNINLSSGFVDTPVKLTPRLLAKALSQSYRSELPDVDSAHNGPDWAQHNPYFMTDDPEFVKLNPGIITPPSGSPIAPLLTEDVSGVNQQVWAWILSDAAARAWLEGTPDENGIVVNPAYKDLRLTAAAIDTFPRADPTCFKTDSQLKDDPCRRSLDVLPYVNNYDDAASHIRGANNPEGATWDPTATSPGGGAGWWRRGGVEPAGQVLMWGLMNTGDLANYGLVPADLCDASGAHCVSVSTASVTTALANAKPGAGGLLRVDPAAPGSGGYPLVAVTYAAVRIDSDAEAMRDYAALINFAAGTGQTAGVEPGQLPHGYLPLSDNLRALARSAAAKLIDAANAIPTAASTNPDTSPTPSQAAQATTAAPAAGASPSSAGWSTTDASMAPVGAMTTPVEIGAARWALAVVVVAGLSGLVGGPLLRSVFGGKATPWRRN